MRRSLLWCCLSLVACSSSEPAMPAATTPPPADPTAALYEPAHIVEVSIEMAEADWEALRLQANDALDVNGGDCQSRPPPSAFTYFHAAVTVDGQAFADVGLRKKGFFGSLSTVKPSLKVSLGHYVPGQELHGLDKLTLNNNRQDDSLVRTCLSYELFAAAGVPASRCNFAHVTVNGEDLGVYTNVEGIDSSMVARHFDDATGRLYEGASSDFREGYLDTFDEKSDQKPADRSDLAAVADALASASDDGLEAALAPLLDVDEFYSFWAMEALVAHWDGFTDNLNNVYVYHDPEDGRFSFIPWGADYTFHDIDLFMPPDRPASVSANEAIAHRLYQVPALAERYVTRLTDLLDTAWKEDRLLAEVDRMQALLTPYADPADGRWAASLDEVRAFIGSRRAIMLADTSGGPAPWPYPLGTPTCQAAAGTMTGTFKTKWGTTSKMNPFLTGTSSMSIQAPGVYEGVSPGGGSAAGDDDGGQAGFGYRHVLQLIGSFPDGTLHVVYMLIPPESFQAGRDVPFDWQQAFGVLGLVDTASEGLLIEGNLNRGNLHFDAAGTNDGDEVSGTFSADLLKGVPAP